MEKSSPMPEAGGRYLRDAATGALTPEQASAPEPLPEPQQTDQTVTPVPDDSKKKGR